MIPFLDSRIERLLAAFLAGAIVVLIYLLHLSSNSVETYREQARQARQAVAELRAAGESAIRERLAAQEAERRKNEAALEAVKESYEADVGRIDARYRAAVARLREQPKPTAGPPGGDPAVPAPTGVAGGPDGGTAELRLLEALRSCEEGVARHNAAVRALRETR